MKRTIYLLLFIIMLSVLTVILTGCDEKQPENTAVTIKTSDLKKEKTNTTSTTNSVEEEKAEGYYKEAAEKQMAKPEKGEIIAIIKVKNFGEMKFKFFKDKTPKSFENFVTHAKEGYYDGLKFHRVMEEFMIQGGDPQGTGAGGESIWGKDFETELDESLVPYKGSLCMARGTQLDSVGSQYFITQANYNPSKESILTQMGYSDELLEQYKEYGGDIGNLYLKYTVFGQMYEGFDVLDKIAKVEKTYSLTGELSVPVEDVIVEKITITEYK